MPARGSVQDLIACEALVRERKRSVTSQMYLARILSAGMNIPEKVFQLLTTLFTMEITQENYFPGTVQAKKAALETLSQNKQQEVSTNVKFFDKLHKLTVEDDADLRPATPAEMEAFKRKLRKRYVRTRIEKIK